MTPETAPAAELSAGNGAHADAPASDPGGVGSDLDRADVAPCPDCAAHVGAAHSAGCDVARCLVTGLQRLSCGEDHWCGADAWTGKWPGVAECEEFGWFAYFVPGAWVPCGPNYPGAHPDLNRLVTQGVWNADAKRWTNPVARTLDVAERTVEKAREARADA